MMNYMLSGFRIASLLLLLCSAQFSFAQFYTVQGTVKDDSMHIPLPGAGILLSSTTDSNNVQSIETDSLGHFLFQDVPQGTYQFMVSFIGYGTYDQLLSISNASLDLGDIRLKPFGVLIHYVTVKGKPVPVTQKGDTLEYNSSAFQTNPDATSEDLLNKMPGVTATTGSVKVNGEDVKQVLVDGKPFFGDDPSMALKNLPADVVDKIQVFDKLSDQAQFTGFDDGNSSKTINIITKLANMKGDFGKVYGGYGQDNLYNAGGNFNWFHGNRRISVLGLFNNINQQNFTSQDLLGLSSGGGSGGSGRGGGGRGSGGNGGGGSSGFSGGSSSGSSNNFLTAQQPGVANTGSGGLNYSDNWGKKIKISASYFFNRIHTIDSASLARSYVPGNTFYQENTFAPNLNYNHRFNLRLDYAIDSFNTVVFTPKLNLQTNRASSLLNASTQQLPLDLNSFLNTTRDSSQANNSGYNYAANLLFQHKFKKPRRTLSLNLESDGNQKTGNGINYSLSEYYNPTDTSFIDQQNSQNTSGYTYSANLVYTEPIDSFSQLMLNYNPSYSMNHIDKEISNFNALQQDYSSLDTLLTNTYQNTYLVQNAGLSLRKNKKKLMLMAGLHVQYASLHGTEIYPDAFTLEKPFLDVLPQAMLNYRFSKTSNLRLLYRTNTNIPGISQLQSVINNSNPILLSTGNINLKQDYEHTLLLRYGKTNVKKSTGFFLYLFGNYAQNYIGNATYLVQHDSTLSNGYLLKSGSQLSMPVNLQGYVNTRSFLTYSFPLGFLKSNLNLNTGFTYNRIPGLINSAMNLANNYNFSQGLVLSSTASENLDFTLSYTGNYSIVKNSLQSNLNNNYYSHTALFKVNWILAKRITLNSSIANSLYRGLSSAYNQDYYLWNAYVSYKFLKDRSLEFKLGVNDLLNQNNNISRTVTDSYVEDDRSNVLHRYGMATLTYTFRKTANIKKANGG